VQFFFEIFFQAAYLTHPSWFHQNFTAGLQELKMGKKEFLEIIFEDENRS